MRGADPHGHTHTGCIPPLSTLDYPGVLLSTLDYPGVLLSTLDHPGVLPSTLMRRPQSAAMFRGCEATLKRRYGSARPRKVQLCACKCVRMRAHVCGRVCARACVRVQGGREYAGFYLIA